jgi:hypothetical protein
MIARFTIGNEKEYWLKERKKCRICGEGDDSIQHMTEDCEVDIRSRSWRDILDDDGRGETWMKEEMRRRKKNEA